MSIEKPRRLVYALVEAMLPGDTSEPVRIEAAWFAQTLIDGMPTHVRLAFKTLMHGCNFATILVCGLPFAFAPLRVRRWIVNRSVFARLPALRDLVMAIRTLALMSYYDHPEVQLTIGYSPRNQVVRPKNVLGDAVVSPTTNSPMAPSIIPTRRVA